MHDQVPKFVRRVEPGAGPVVLVGAQHDDGVVGEGQRERVNVHGAERQADHGYAVGLEQFHDVRRRSRR